MLMAKPLPLMVENQIFMGMFNQIRFYRDLLLRIWNTLLYLQVYIKAGINFFYINKFNNGTNNCPGNLNTFGSCFRNWQYYFYFNSYCTIAGTSAKEGKATGPFIGNDYASFTVNCHFIHPEIGRKPVQYLFNEYFG